MKKMMSKCTAVLVMILLVQFLLPLDVLAMQDDPAEEELTGEVLPDDPVLTDPSQEELPGGDYASGFEIGEEAMDPDAEAILAELPEQGFEKAGLLFELKDERASIYQKNFLNNNGSFTAVRYGFPVHYRESVDGPLLDIDNTLVLKERSELGEEAELADVLYGGKGAEGKRIYVPSGSPLQVALAEDNEGTYLAAAKREGYVLSWQYEELKPGLWKDLTGEDAFYGSGPYSFSPFTHENTVYEWEKEHPLPEDMMEPAEGNAYFDYDGTDLAEPERLDEDTYGEDIGQNTEPEPEEELIESTGGDWTYQNEEGEADETWYPLTNIWGEGNAEGEAGAPEDSGAYAYTYEYPEEEPEEREQEALLEIPEEVSEEAEAESAEVSGSTEEEPDEGDEEALQGFSIPDAEEGNEEESQESLPEEQLTGTDPAGAGAAEEEEASEGAEEVPEAEGVEGEENDTEEAAGEEITGEESPEEESPAELTEEETEESEETEDAQELEAEGKEPPSDPESEAQEESGDGTEEEAGEEGEDRGAEASSSEEEPAAEPEEEQETGEPEEQGTEEEEALPEESAEEREAKEASEEEAIEDPKQDEQEEIPEETADTEKEAEKEAEEGKEKAEEQEAERKIPALQTEVLSLRSREELPPEREAIVNLLSGLAYRTEELPIETEYILSGDQLKENLILKSPEAGSRFRIVYDIGSLSARSFSDREIDLLDPEGDVIFRITAPYLADAEGKRSSRIVMQILAEHEGKLLVELACDPLWLAEEERTYPVTVDPYIVFGTDRSDEDATATYIRNTSHPYGTLACGNDFGSSHGKTKFYVKFTLPELSQGDRIVGGLLSLTQYDSPYGYEPVNSGSLRVGAYRVTSSWTASSVIASSAYSGLPSKAGSLLDYADISSVSVRTGRTLDISRTVKGWYEGTLSNYGIVVESMSPEEFQTVRFVATDNSTLVAERPLLLVQYVNNRGLESYWTNHEISLGESGSLYLSDFSGNPVGVFPIATTPGGYLPVTLSLVYNGYQARSYDHYDIKAGMGMRLSVLERVTYINPEASELYAMLYAAGYSFIYEDGDGTCHYFKGENGTYQDEDGLGLTLTLTNDSAKPYQLSADDGSYKSFTNQGLLKEIHGKDGVGVITLTYSGSGSTRLTKITDGGGKEIEIETDANWKVTKVKDAADREILFTYDAAYPDYLTGITYPDGRATTLHYTGGKLDRVTARDGYRVQLTYDSTSSLPHIKARVVCVTEYDNSGSALGTSTQGRKIELDYSAINQTIFTDVTDENNKRTETYQFDSFGRTMSVKDCTGGISDLRYEGKPKANEPVSRKTNALKFSSYGEKYVRNLLNNHSFEEGLTHFGRSGSEVTADDSTAYIGYKSCKLDGAGAIVMQSYPGTGEQWYTFSAFLKTGSDPTGVRLRIRFMDASGNTISNSSTPRIEYQVSSFTRYHVSAKSPAGTEEIRLYVEQNDTGTTWTDCWQFEKTASLNRYNMVENGGFDEGLDSWISSAFVTGSGDGLFTISDGNPGIKITGDTTSNKFLYQNVYIGKNAQTVSFILSGSMRSYGIPLKYDDSLSPSQNRHAGIGILCYYEDGTYDWAFADGNEAVTTWQRKSYVFHFTQNKVIEKVRPFFCFWKNGNYAYFDSMQLDFDQYGETYTVNADGKVTKVNANSGKRRNYSYNDAKAIIGISTEENKSYTYTYDSTKAHHLKTAKSNDTSLLFTLDYDNKYNVTSYQVKGSDNKYIEETAGYSTSGDYLTSSTDEAGNTTSYVNSAYKGMLLRTTDPAGNTRYYKYDADSDRRTGMGMTSSASTILYSYTAKNELDSVNTPQTKYTFTYDSFGNPVSEKAAGTDLTTRAYEAKNGELLSVTYANGLVKNYGYDANKRLNQEKYGSVTKAWYYYNSTNQIGRVNDLKAGKVTEYTYDLAGRPIRLDDSDGNYLSAKYDKENAVTYNEVKYKTGRYGMGYLRGLDRRVDEIHFYSLGKEKLSYDPLGRVTKKTRLKSSETTDESGYTSYTYYSYGELTGDNTNANRTTGLVKKVTQSASGSATLLPKARTYTYNSRGLIESVTENSKTHSYVYDANGQLTRSNDQAAGFTYVYSYDSAGNIKSKKTYAYTTGTVSGTPISTVTYTYPTSTAEEKWNDQLSAYSGQVITYDDLGNMRTRGTASMTWSGREMTGYSKGTTTATYQYDINGTRIGKTVNGTTTEYFAPNGKILAEYTGTTLTCYLYDQNGLIEGMRRGGKTYYFLKNMEGDVLGLLEKDSGDVVARYTYDDWGNCISVENAAGYTVGTFNPFRYRGYYYDKESGLYYVGTRYYDPEIGRWISPDSMENLGINGNVQSYNLYVYGMNDPVNTVDEDGELPQFVIGALLGAAFEICAELVENGGDIHAIDKKKVVVAAATGAITSINGISKIAGALCSGFGCALIESFNADATTKSICTAFGVGVASYCIGSKAETLLKQGGGKIPVNGVVKETGMPCVVSNGSSVTLPTKITTAEFTKRVATANTLIGGLGGSLISGTLKLVNNYAY